MRDGEAALRERRVLDVFDQALAWAPEDRMATLHAMFADDPVLIRRVERLFAAQNDAHLMSTHPPELSAHAQAPPEAAPSQRIGAYRLAERIGEGGMGTVHRAERIEGGFAQTVAIKLIRGGLFSGAATERFAKERAILARLQHPHITRLYDGGVTADGQSYIVMELVDGEPITQRAAGFDLPARLALFGEVCDAVGYAHQQGVVHADIKPGNVLIDRTNGVKLLDFGISALVTADDPSSGAFTAAYASPQQRQGERPTPADDVFALGCLLSALTEPCAKSRPAELRAVIARARAADPRDRYVSCGALADDVQRLCRGFPVRARPATRWRELAFFWRRHRIASSAAAAALAGLAVAVVVTTTLEIRAQAARAQADQRFVEVRALSHYLLDDVTDQLQAYPGTSALRRDIATRSRAYLEGLSRVPGASPEIGLEVAQGYIKTGRILGLPDVQGMGDAAAARQDLAKAEVLLRALLAGRPDEALRTGNALAQALTARAAIARTVDNDAALSRHLYDEAARLTAREPHDPPSVDQRLTHARALIGVAELLDDSGKPADMLAPLDEAAADLSVVPPEPDRVSRALTRATMLNLRGDATYYLGDVAGSLALYRQAASVLDAARDKTPDMRLLERGAFTSWNVASVLDELGRKAEGLAVIDRGVADAELMRLFENSTRAQHVVDIVHTQRAQALASLGRFDEAIAQARAELADVRATAAASPGSFEAARAVPVVLRPVGEIYLAAGRRADACAAFTEARHAWQRLAGTAGVTGFDTATELPVLDREIAQCQDQTSAPALRDTR
jgi:serine/threonine-protein kinase